MNNIQKIKASGSNMTELSEKVKLILSWLVEKKAEQIKTYDFTDKLFFTDYVIICEGQADLHVRAIGNYLLEKVKENHYHLLSKEGLEYAHWVLLDLGEVIIHIFLPETRQYYQLDEFIDNFLQKAESREKEL
ncbi:MAG: ribosome silencing factor [Candidatus Cloacimonadaceae bacterium]